MSRCDLALFDQNVLVSKIGVCLATVPAIVWFLIGTIGLAKTLLHASSGEFCGRPCRSRGHFDLSPMSTSQTRSATMKALFSLLCAGLGLVRCFQSSPSILDASVGVLVLQPQIFQ